MTAPIELNKDRADYGAKVFKRLAADTGIEKRTLYQVFLNNALLERGLAERKDAWEFSDWEKQALA